MRLLPKDITFNERLIDAYFKNQDYVRAGQLIQRCLHLMPEESRFRRLEAEMHLRLKQHGHNSVAVEANG
jgi:Flp pilus assembly protein TadD